MNKKLISIIVCLLVMQACSPFTATTVPAPASATNTTVPPISTPTQTPRPTNTIEPTPTAIPVTWKQISDAGPFERAVVTSIAIDPQNPDILFVGTLSAGVYKSTDGGASWQAASKGLREMRLHSVLIDPTNTNIIYVGLEQDRVYKSTDGGENWSPAHDGLNDSGYWHQRLLMSPQDPRTLYYVSSPGLYRTENGGASWVKISFPCGRGMTDMAINPVNTDTLYVGYYGEGGCQSPGLYISTNRGKTWKILRTFTQKESPVPWEAGLSMDITGSYLYSIHANRTQTMVLSYAQATQEWNNTSINCSLVVPHPGVERTAYCGTEDGALYITTNGGMNWTFLSNPNIGPVKSIAFSPDDPSRIYVGGYGLVYSDNGGRTWKSRDTGLRSIFYEIKIQPVTHDFFAHQWTSDNLVYQSMDNGATWKMIKRNCRIDFAPNGIVYCWGWVPNNISYNNGRTWQELQGSSPYWGTYADPYKPNEAYSLVDWNTGITYTNNGARSWITVDKRASSLKNPAFIFASDQKTIYVLGEWSMYKSIGGKVWSPCTLFDGYTPLTETRAVIDPNTASTIFVATRGSGITMSKDGCQSWNSFDDQDGWFVNSLFIDPNNSGTLYAGTDLGVYVSYDLGETWGAINEGLPGASPVYSIVVDKDSNVYAATPYGIYQLEKQ